jgi:hypothetical protein
MAKSDLIDIVLELRHETPRAYLVSDDGKTEHWLPKSMVEKGEDLPRAAGKISTASEFTMPEWLAKREGFI